jgi:hypothetical protein
MSSPYKARSVQAVLTNKFLVCTHLEANAKKRQNRQVCFHTADSVKLRDCKDTNLQGVLPGLCALLLCYNYFNYISR